jgi:hypothetical protein
MTAKAPADPSGHSSGRHKLGVHDRHKDEQLMQKESGLLLANNPPKLGVQLE